MSKPADPVAQNGEQHGESEGARLRPGRGPVPRAGLLPFGIGAQKPHHYLEMARILWDNRARPGYALRILTEGVCDGCALGTSGLHDWTLDDDAWHMCLVRLNLLKLNTMDALDPVHLRDVADLRRLPAGELRDLGRLPYPMRRHRGERGFRRISWDEAIRDIGGHIRQAGGPRVATYLTSRGLTNEVYFATQKAMRLCQSPHVDNAARLCHSPSTAAMKSTLGVAASTCSYRDWYGSDLIVFFGSNPANDQPVAMKYLYEARRHGTRVAAVNTLIEPGLRRYWVPSTADSAVFGSRIADRFFQVRTGGDLSFCLAVQRRLIERDAVDRAFIDAHTEGFDEYARHTLAQPLERLCQQAGTTAAEVEAFADMLCAARTAVFVWSMGLTQHAHGADTVRAVCCLGLSRGYVGRERCGLMPIRGHSGVQGGAEMGAYATAFPGGLAVNDEHAQALEGLWGFRPPAEPGLHAVAMVEAAGRGELDVLYTVGGNFLETLPQPEHVAEALHRVPVRVHQDIALTTSMLVDPAETVYLLPARTRYEHRGGVTETTTERRVIFSPYIPGHDVGEAMEEWWIPMRLSQAAYPERAHLIEYADAAAIRRDIAATVPSYAGIEGLSKRGDQIQWGGARLCEGGKFPLPGGRARFLPLDPPSVVLRDGEFLMATRRGKQFNSIVQAEVDGLTGAARDHVLMSQEDLDRLGLLPDQAVLVHNRHGRLRGRVFPAPLMAGNVQLHWPEANVLIARGRLDPGGQVPDYNAVVRISPI